MIEVSRQSHYLHYQRAPLISWFSPMAMSRTEKRFRLPSGVVDFAVSRNTPEINEPRTNSPREILRPTDNGCPDHRNQAIAEPAKNNAKYNLKYKMYCSWSRGGRRAGISSNTNKAVYQNTYS